MHTIIDEVIPLIPERVKLIIRVVVFAFFVVLATYIVGLLGFGLFARVLL